MFPVGDGGGEEELWHVRSGGRSVTHVPSGGWWRRGGSLPCTQRGTLSDTCPQWGMVEERRISAMYAVGDTHICSQWGMVEEDLWHVRSDGRSVTRPQWGMVEERRISAMYAVGDAQ